MSIPRRRRVPPPEKIGPMPRLLQRLRSTLIAKERESGLTVTEFAAKLGMPRSTYFALKYGQAKLTIQRAEELARALNLSELGLFGVPPEAEPPLPPLIENDGDMTYRANRRVA